jgi:hypothetical protein
MRVSQSSDLSDAQLVAEVKRLIGCERGAIARLIVHVAEMDDREIHLAAGFPSLYAYCVKELQLSEYEAYSRIEVARAARSFPLIFRMLEERALTLTTVQLLARKLTAENHDALLSAAAGRSKREVQELLARFFPQPDAPAAVRKVPSPEAMPTPASIEPPVLIDLPVGANTAVPAMVVEPVVRATPAAPSTHRPVVTPLAPDRYRVTFTADAETCEMLDLAKDLLRHAVPSGDTAQVVKRALKTLLEDLARKKFAATEKPRKAGGSAGHGSAAHSRSIPAAVKRAVWIRDGGRCAFAGPKGRRCTGRAFLEFHHLEAYAKGGKATLENLQLRCRAHNAYEADLEFGRRQARGQTAVEQAYVPYRTAPSTRSGPSRTPRPTAATSRDETERRHILTSPAT